MPQHPPQLLLPQPNPTPTTKPLLTNPKQPSIPTPLNPQPPQQKLRIKHNNILKPTQPPPKPLPHHNPLQLTKPPTTKPYPIPHHIPPPTIGDSTTPRHIHPKQPNILNQLPQLLLKIKFNTPHNSPSLLSTKKNFAKIHKIIPITKKLNKLQLNHE